MSEFTRPDSVLIDRETHTRKLVRPWTHTYSIGEDLFRITIPSEVEYAPTTVKAAEWMVPRSLMEAASLPHDALYKIKGRVYRSSVTVQKWGKQIGVFKSVRTVSRYHADRLFLRIMKEDGVFASFRYMAYVGVRLGGWLAWNDEEFPEPLRKETVAG